MQTTGTRTLGAVEPTSDGPTVASIEAGDPRASRAYKQGYDAMQAVLDSIDRAEDPLSRADVVNAFMSTSGSQTEVGALTIGADGAAVYESGQG